MMMMNTRKKIISMFENRLVYENESKIIKPIFHVSNYEFDKFDIDETAQGILWFSMVSFDDALEDLHGASINFQRPIYLYECEAIVYKSAGWDEYDKYTLGQLKDLGYDSIILDEDLVLFNDSNVKINNVKVVNK